MSINSYGVVQLMPVIGMYRTMVKPSLNKRTGPLRHRVSVDVGENGEDVSDVVGVIWVAEFSRYAQRQTPTDRIHDL